MKTEKNLVTGSRTQQLVALLVCLAGVCATQSLAAEPAKTEKFDLVFLVGVDEAELRPGIKVFVEPMFFTDGKELMFVYDYCRRDFERVNKSGSSWKSVGKNRHEIAAKPCWVRVSGV